MILPQLEQSNLHATVKLWLADRARIESSGSKHACERVSMPFGCVDRSGNGLAYIAGHHRLGADKLRGEPWRR